jgi:hypothetical protein
MTDETLQHVTTLFFGWSYKIVALVVGYLFARLGYALFLKGVTGQFTFHMELKGAKADLVSASPGLFLILMGAIIIGVGLYRGMSVQITERPRVAEPAKEGRLPERPARPELPRVPPPEGERR